MATTTKTITIKPPTAQEQLLSVADRCAIAAGAFKKQARLLTLIELANNAGMDYEKVAKLREKLGEAISHAHAAQQDARDSLDQILP